LSKKADEMLANSETSEKEKEVKTLYQVIPEVEGSGEGLMNPDHTY
jgi:hypothetical protein